MAFVDRSEKKTTHNKSTTEDSIGPGSYLAHLEYNVKQQNVPFNSSVIRDSDPKVKQVLPGPGQYFINSGPQNEKVVVLSQNEEIKIIEIPKPLSIFKSETKRFETQVKDENPGVGNYEFKSQFDKPTRLTNVSNRNDIIDTLIKINKYQSVPSIPSKFQRQGYTENAQNELVLTHSPDIYHQGVKKDSVGPGQYDLTEQIKNNWKKGNEWHKVKSRDTIKQSQINGIGPGQYNINQFEPLYKHKPSPAFASKLLRHSNVGTLRKSQVLKSASIRSFSTGTGLPQEYDEQDEYIEDCTPGPGNYLGQSEGSSLKIQKKLEKFQFFGSSVDRFQYTNQLSQLGPGVYNPKPGFGKDIGMFKVQNPPFQSSDTRFENKNIFQMNPGPGQYQSTQCFQSLEKVLIKNIQNGYKGNFGINDKRFKNNYPNFDNPGPGQYIEPIKELNSDDYHQSAVFQSVLKRGSPGKIEKQPAVGSYQIDHYDIKKNIFKNDDPDELIVQRPGFGHSAPRFKQAVLETVNEEEQLLSPRTQGKKLADYDKQQPKPVVPFASKQKRFDYEKSQKKTNSTGPGQYFNPHNNNWNKRTYNILFAEI